MCYKHLNPWIFGTFCGFVCLFLYLAVLQYTRYVCQAVAPILLCVFCELVAFLNLVANCAHVAYDFGAKHDRQYDVWICC